MFNQLTCLGVKIYSKRSQNLFAFVVLKVSFNAAALCEAGLSITKVMVSAL
jgi:hypothetical protein